MKRALEDPNASRAREHWPVLQEGAELDVVCMGLSLLVGRGLRAGDIVVFDGHVVHRGKSYGLRHVGMHAYLDVPGVQ